MSHHNDLSVMLNVILYILEKNGGIIDIHRLFKCLYFADIHHIRNYGRPISFEDYHALPKGPVPTFLYDEIKKLQTHEVVQESEAVYTINGQVYQESKPFKSIYKKGFNIYSNQKPDLDYLSESELESINYSFNDNCNLAHKELTEKSHGHAWDKAFKNNNKSIRFEFIAEELGLDKNMIEYVNDTYKIHTGKL
jgi:uncharacterized phage-associated protein